MSDPVIEWRRFWAPTTGTFNLSDRGYLVDPETEAGRVFNRDVRPFSAIADQRCLALLGEPGIGKTTTMQSLRSEVDASLSGAGDRSLWLNLNICSQESTLYRKLFDSTLYREWLGGQFTLHLFLDSLDECLVRIDSVAALLLNELREAPLDRLRLRITCRTAEWPRLLREGLKEVFGKAAGEYELVPLRRRDVKAAAEAMNIDAEQFLEEIDRRDVKSFAIKPVTLFFLLRVFEKNANIPHSQIELFRQGCLALCSEQSASRQAGRMTGDLEPRQRILILRRIAALMMLCKRSAVLVDTSPGVATDEDLSIDEICGGTERDGLVHAHATADAVREVLDSGLFTSRGPGRLGWAHQTYLEFLASEYVNAHGFTDRQIGDLLIHPSDPERVVPQLHELAAWIATANERVFDMLVRGDPQVLLRSDVESVDDARKRQVIESLLEGMSEGRLTLDWDLARRYRRLKHPAVLEQVMPFMLDKTKRMAARLTAIQIVQGCELASASDALLGIALDETEVLRFRREAVSAIAEVGSAIAKGGLKGLAALPPGAIDDGLKSDVFEALWPDQLSVDELFRFLSAPTNPNHYGAYHSFSHSIAKDLKDSDLPRALEWVAIQPPAHMRGAYFADVCDAILTRAWEHLDDAGTLAAFVKVAVHRLSQYEP